ncbi:hypothetical protein LTR84_002915 [Exophiala bonariae]|uniref:Uncharacterized protein n=1 Tax=Exophiala bonariae TaxID=1690606 RepID=A0AAV9NA17_9EURO|nr:hypothetical protein LTR84_002915 [Exophiala bonariae]
MSENKSSGYASKLTAKRVLVLGGTSGIGLAVAEAVKEFGGKIFVSSSSQSKIDAAISRLNAAENKVLYRAETKAQGYRCELDNLEELESNLIALFEHVTEGRRHKLDHVVYTAGNKVGSVPLTVTDTKMITEHGILRFYVPIIIGKLALDYITVSAQSSITLTSGVNNIKPVAGRVLMAGWGSGVEGITRALAVDLRPIRVNCICPGPTKTELFDGFPDDVLQPLLERYKSSTMTRTIGTPEDVSESYLYCMRDTFVDGTVIHSSGGYLLA